MCAKCSVNESAFTWALSAEYGDVGYRGGKLLQGCAMGINVCGT
jgi:hypothetical protein